jgi:hypothetical protein
MFGDFRGVDVGVLGGVSSASHALESVERAVELCGGDCGDGPVDARPARP